MKKPKTLIFVLFSTAVLIWGGISRLSRFPLEVFLLKGAEGNMEAYRLKLFLNRRDPEVESVPLSSEQQKTGFELLKQRDVRGLSEFSKAFGKQRVVIGYPSAEEGWPAYLGGAKTFLEAGSGGAFDNLGWPDRFYLALATNIPPMVPLVASPTQPDHSTATDAVPVNATEVPTPLPAVHTGALRVEILNGCGIKGAADWAARRLSGQGITITDTGNADSFHFAKTLVKSSAGLPISLQEAVERLGLTKESIEEAADPAAAVDVVVIVGGDYRKLREGVRGRNQH